MTYSRQQRERAVDLYIKYEHSAADVIHELGYPSRTILYVWYRERPEEERAGVPSGRGQRHRRYSDGQKRAAVDHCLEYGRRPGRTMRMLGYPKSKELLMAWIDELAPGQRKLRHGPVPEELKREAVVAVASGRMKSREAAAGLGVQAAVVRNRKRQMLAKSREEPVSETERGKAVARAGNPAGARPAVPNSSDAAGLADALASMQRKVAELQARLDALDADVERQRREKRELDVEIAIRRGTLELLGKGPGADCLCSISCCGFSHDDFSGLGRACRPRNGLNWMVLVSPPERTGKDYDQHAPSTVYPSFAAERGIPMSI